MISNWRNMANKNLADSCYSMSRKASDHLPDQPGMFDGCNPLYDIQQKWRTIWIFKENFELLNHREACSPSTAHWEILTKSLEWSLNFLHFKDKFNRSNYRSRPDFPTGMTSRTSKELLSSRRGFHVDKTHPVSSSRRPRCPHSNEGGTSSKTLMSLLAVALSADSHSSTLQWSDSIICLHRFLAIIKSEFS